MFKSWQLRAIREAKGWSQGQLAKRAYVTQPTISALEKGTGQDANIKTIHAIINAFEAEGFYFTHNGIEYRTTNTFTMEGEDVYLRLLHHATEALEAGQTFFKSGANERRSSPAVIAQLEAMRVKGIVTRSLMQPGDTYLMGALDDYRWMDDALYTKGDVKVIYAHRVAYLVSWADPPKLIVIEDTLIAEDAKRVFEYLWRHSDKPSHSDAPTRFAGVDHG